MQAADIISKLVWISKLENNICMFYRVQAKVLIKIDLNFSRSLIKFCRYHQMHKNNIDLYVGRMGACPDERHENMKRVVNIVSRFNDKNLKYQNLLKMDFILQKKLCADYTDILSYSECLDVQIKDMLLAYIKQEKKLLKYFEDKIAH